MSTLSGWLRRIANAIVTTLFGSAIAGGVLFWLRSKGFEVDAWIARTVDFAIEPENSTLLYVCLALMGGVLLTVFVFVFVRIAGRKPLPARSRIEALRAVINEIEEECLNAINGPDEKASATLSRFRLLARDLYSDPQVGETLKHIHDTTDQFLIVSSEVSRHLNGAQAELEANLHQAAVVAITQFRLATQWAVYEPAAK